MAGFGTNVPTALRQSAAARNLGAPKGVTKAPAAKTFNTTGGSKPPAVKAAVKVSMPKAAAKAPVRATKSTVKATPAPRKSGGGESLALSELSPAQTAHRALKQAQASEKAESEPYQKLLSEIHGQEGTAAKQYAGYGQTAQATLGSLGAAQESSAKTFENQAAENALTQGKAIETTGQVQGSMTGGYVAPELRAQLNAEGTQAKEAGATQNSFAQNSAQAGGNLMTGLRAAAVQRNQEGLTRGIPNAFAKEANSVQEKLGTVVGKVGATADKNREALEKNQYNERATNEKLAHEGVKIGQEGVYKQGVVRNAAASTAEKGSAAAATNATNVAKVNATKENAEEKNTTALRVAEGKNKAGRANAQEANKDKVRIAEIKEKGAAAGSAAGRKYAAAVNNAYSVVHQEIEAGRKTGAKGQQLYNIAVKQLEEGKHTGSGRAPGKPLGANLIHAAMSLIYNGGKLTGKTRIEAIENGVPETSPWLQ
jgi:hypothetical protein